LFGLNSEVAIMIVVTGPNGNVGTTVPYRIAAHTPAKIAARYGAHVPTARFDYADQSTWAATLEGITTLFLLFPLPHPRTARTWMVPFVEAAVAAGCEHIVYISVPGADTTKVVPHHTVEAAIKASGVGYTILRAAYFSQNLIRDITTHAIDIAQHNEIFIPAGQGQTSFVDSRDVARVAFDVLTDPGAHRGQEYLLTGPESLTFTEVAELMTAELGRPIRYSNPWFPEFWWRMGQRGVSWDTIFFMTLVYSLTRFGKNNPVSDTLPRLLGQPATTMRQFIADHRARWMPETAGDAVRVKTPGLLG
jgi:uncharacterized protein YbjT (DUF2867 family)